MKRMIPTAIIFALIIVICAVSNIAVCRRVDEARKQIEECKYLYENKRYSEALECALSFKSRWENSSKSISAYSNHCPLDDISTLAAILPEAVRQKDGFEVLSTISQIKTALDTIHAEQSFTFQSMY